MCKGKVRSLPATGRAVDEPFLYKIRFIYLLNRTRVLPYCCSDGSETHRTALELVNNGIQYLVVNGIETALVDIQSIEGIGSYFRIDVS